MTTMNLISNEAASDSVKEMFTAAKAKIGMVPNLLRVMANAPQVLGIYLSTTGALATGTLSAKAREQIAVALAAANNCEYCLSAHTLVGKMSGVSADDLVATQSGKTSDPKVQAILDLALEVNRTHGNGSAGALVKAREAGLSDAEILETLAHVSINILTNSINGMVGTEVDFPKVALVNKQAA